METATPTGLLAVAASLTPGPAAPGLAGAMTASGLLCALKVRGLEPTVFTRRWSHGPDDGGRPSEMRGGAGRRDSATQSWADQT